MSYICFHGSRVTDLGRPGVALKESNRSFLSIIRRARVSHSPESKSTLFTEYEIVCQMRLLADTLEEKEIVYKWSVWKRYSEFVILHKVSHRHWTTPISQCEMPCLALPCLASHSIPSHIFFVSSLMLSVFSSYLQAIMKSLGWLMKAAHLPPSKTFTYDKTSAEFIEKRR